MVASGQKAGRNRKTQAHIRIWSTETLQTLYVFGMGEFEVGVSAVAFSQLVRQAHIDFSKTQYTAIIGCFRTVEATFWQLMVEGKVFFRYGSGNGDTFLEKLRWVQFKNYKFSLFLFILQLLSNRI